MRPVKNIQDLKRGMLLWARYPDEKDNSDWMSARGQLIEVVTIHTDYNFASVDAQILNGGQYHGTLANYEVCELHYLDP